MKGCIILFEPGPRQYKKSNDVIIFLPHPPKNIDFTCFIDIFIFIYTYGTKNNSMSKIVAKIVTINNGNDKSVTLIAVPTNTLVAERLQKSSQTRLYVFQRK